MKLKFIDFDSSKEGVDYGVQLRKLKRQYNKEENIIVFKQVFTSEFIRRANENLQTCIDHKRVWFASKTSAQGSEFTKQSNCKINLKWVGENTVGDFIETQDTLVYQTKKQCALIEVKTTSKGTQTFDLPQHLKRNTSTTRARRDNYTALMLASWATKCYFDSLDFTENINSTFTPRMIH